MYRSAAFFMLSTAFVGLPGAAFCPPHLEIGEDRSNSKVHQTARDRLTSGGPFPDTDDLLDIVRY
jgi:hypothetical protein